MTVGDLRDPANELPSLLTGMPKKIDMSAFHTQKDISAALVDVGCVLANAVVADGYTRLIKPIAEQSAATIMSNARRPGANVALPEN